MVNKVSDIWNPWHGCHKKSEACLHCYMFYFDQKRGIDSNIIKKNKDNFDLPLKKKKDGSYKIPSGSHIRVCLTSDFFLREADEWRHDCWKIMKERSDISFSLFTKRPERVQNCLPSDWKKGYPNVSLFVTCENQSRAQERLPILINLPFQNKGIMAEPLLEEIQIDEFLQTGEIKQIYCGGENYENARPLNLKWVEKLSNSAKKYNVSFEFFDPGAYLIKKESEYHFKDHQSQLNFLKTLPNYNHKGNGMNYQLTKKEEQLTLF